MAMVRISWKVLHFARVWLCLDALASLGILGNKVKFKNNQSKSSVFLAKCKSLGSGFLNIFATTGK